MCTSRNPISPDLVLEAYRHGLFPMADSGSAEDFGWYSPLFRGVLPIPSFHVPKRLRRTLLRFPFDVSIDTDFPAVIRACAEPAKKRSETWINGPIRDVFIALHDLGHAHSVECRKDGVLVGGLYGLQIGGAFFGESMFSRKTDASRVALVHLVARLYAAGFTLLDTQFVNEHLLQFGVQEIPQDAYLERLRESLALSPEFCLPKDEKTLLADFLLHRDKNPQEED